MYPSFIIIGSTKCASSSLHNYLGQHPDIFTSKIKETGFFSLRYNKGMDFYATYFQEATNQKAIGEATPTYCFLPYVAPRIKEHFPDIKLILCLRNPLERAFSSWLMKTGLGEETLPFDTSMDISKKMLEYTRDKLASPEGEKYWIENNKNFSATDEKRPRTYILAGRYAEMIKLYTKYFKPEQIKIIFFDEMRKDLDGKLSELFQFVGVNPDFVVPNKESVNFYYDRKFTKIIMSVLGQKLGRSLINAVPKNIKDGMRKNMKKTEPPKLSMEDRLKYWDCFKDDVEELEKIIGKDLSSWNPNKKLIHS